MRDPFRRAATTAGALLVILTATAAADESIYDITARAARDRDVDASHSLAKIPDVVPASELGRDGGLLVGFEFGLGKLNEAEVIYAVRPVYRTPTREWSDSEYGAFNGRDTRVTKRRRVVARPGYAVGGLILGQGEFVTGASLIFMEIGAKALKPESTYTSDWVGDRQGGATETLTGKGAPVIGVFAARKDNQLRALGLFYVHTAKPAEEPPPTPQVVKPSGPTADDSEAASLAAQAQAYREQQAEQTRWLWVGIFSAVALLSTIAGILVRNRRQSDDEERIPFRLPDA